MKKIFSTFCIALASLAICSAQTPSANDMVRAEVRLQSSTDRKDIKNSTTDTKTQHVALNITLSGKPKSPETRVVKWVIFGKNVNSNRVSILESDEVKLSLDARGQQLIETRSAVTKSTPDHTVVSRGQRNRVSAKKVEGSGVKYFGFGVQVKDGAMVVGKTFSGQSLEAEVK